jgi:hypothetical protein
MRQNLDHVIPEMVDALGKFAGELFVGGGEREFGAGMNQIGDSFRLRQINASVEKCAPRKLTRLGQARAVLQNRVQNHFRGQESAVAGNFHHVLARERPRRAHHRQQNFIDVLTMANDLAIMNCVGWRDGWFERRLADGNKTLVSHGERLRAGKANDGQSAFTEWRCDGSDGVVKHGEKLQVESYKLQVVRAVRKALLVFSLQPSVCKPRRHAKACNPTCD